MNEEEFWDLLEPEREAIWKLSYGLTGSYDDAGDLASEAFLAAYKSFSSLRDKYSFRKFLSTITVRLHRRKRWRNRIFMRLQDVEDSSYEPIRESSHDLDLLLASLMKLPVSQRETIVLFEISGLSLKEIRKVQGGTMSGVKSRLSRARENLRKLLTDDELIKSRKQSAGKEAQNIPPIYRIQTS